MDNALEALRLKTTDVVIDREGDTWYRVVDGNGGEKEWMNPGTGTPSFLPERELVFIWGPLSLPEDTRPHAEATAEALARRLGEALDLAKILSDSLKSVLRVRPPTENE